MEQSDSSYQELEGVHIGTDLDTDWDLCGSFDETEELNYEEDLRDDQVSGEVQSDSPDEESNKEDA